MKYFRIFTSRFSPLTIDFVVIYKKSNQLYSELSVMPLSIQCQKRPLNTKPNALRREGLLPTTLYGHNGTESMQLVVDKKEAALMLRDVKVNETIINVDIPDLSWKVEVILNEIQAHPWKRSLIHLSFCYVLPNK